MCTVCRLDHFYTSSISKELEQKTNLFKIIHSKESFLQLMMKMKHILVNLPSFYHFIIFSCTGSWFPTLPEELTHRSAQLWWRVQPGQALSFHQCFGSLVQHHVAAKLKVTIMIYTDALYIQHANEIQV